jgi:hypothetical protein
MSVVTVLTVAMFVYLQPSPLPPTSPALNIKDQITKSLQAQDLAVQQNATKCLPIYGIHSGVLCLPQDQQKINELKGNGMV